MALRTVGVELVAKIGSYVRNMNTAERATRDVRDEVDKAAKSAPALAGGLAASGHAADNAAGDMDDAARAAAALDRRIDELNRSLREMAVTQALTGDNLGKQMRTQEAEMRRLARSRSLLGDLGRSAAPQIGADLAAGLNRALRDLNLTEIDIKANPRDALAAIALTEAKLRELSGNAATVEVKVRTEKAIGELSQFRKSLGDVGDGAGQDMGRGLIGGLKGSISTLPSLLRGNMIAVAAGLGAVLSPTLGGAVAGAVIGGAAGAGIIGGIVLAARDPRIQQAGKALGQELLGDLQSRASVFVQPMYEGIEKIRARWQSLGPDLDRIFAANRFVSPLIDAAINAAQKITAGVADLVDKADPVMSALAQMVDRVGATTGRTLSLLAGDADEAALAIKDLTDIITGLITATGAIVHATATVRGWIDVSYDAARTAVYWIEQNSALSKTLKDVGIQMDITRDAGRRLGGGTFAAAKGMDAAAAAAGGAVGPAVSFTDAMLAAESQMADVERAAYGDRSALVSLSRTMQAQLNPVMGLIEAQRTFKKAQDDSKAAHDRAAEAVRKYGVRSNEARVATRKAQDADLDLASAALNLTGKAGALGDKFDGHLTPAMKTVFRNAGLTRGQIKNVEKSFEDARRAGEKFDKNYRANVSITGNKPVSDRLWALGEIQRHLKAGNLTASMNSYLHNVAQGRLAEGGGVPGSSPHKKADNVLIAATAGEHMWTVDEVNAAGGHQNVKKLRQMVLSGALDPAAIAAYAGGGVVGMPYPVNASKTRVPSVAEAEAAVIPAVPAGVGGPGTWRTIIKLARALVPGVGVISTVRPGAVTLSGNRSYHAVGRAVDFAPSMQLARKWNITYGKRTLEEITPWRQYDLWHGRAHHYSAALHAQHSGGNAHVHIAMNRGGLLREPVVGYGTATGHSYSFAENGPEGVVPQQYLAGGGSTTVINVTLQNNAPIGSQMELDNWLVGSIDRLRYRVRV